MPSPVLLLQIHYHYVHYRKKNYKNCIDFIKIKNYKNCIDFIKIKNYKNRIDCITK